MTDLTSVVQSIAQNVHLTDVLSALVIFIIGLLIIKFLSRLLYKALVKSGLNEKARQLILTGTRTVCYIVVIIAAIAKLGINTSSLVAVLTVLSLGITLAVEDVIANIAGGLIILMTHPFNLGDYVSLGGVEGTVSQIHINHSRLNTANGEVIVIPNKEISTSKITNYTYLGGRRIVITVGASYDTPTADVRAALLEAAAEQKTLMPGKESIVYLTAFGESNIEYTLYVWVKPADFFTTKMQLHEAIRECFAKHGVEMSYNHMNIHMM